MGAHVLLTLDLSLSAIPGDPATLTAPASPRPPDTPDECAAENVGRLPEGDPAHRDNVKRHNETVA